MKKNFKLLTSFVFFWTFLLLFKFGGGLHYALLSPLGERLMPLWVVGMLISLGALIQLILDVPVGIVLDKFGYKKILIMGAALFAMAGVLIFLKLSTPYFVASMLFSTLGWLSFGPGVNAYALSHASKKTAGAFMAHRDIFSSIGTVLSCVILPFIILTTNTTIGTVIALLMALACVSLCFSPKDEKKIGLLTHPHEKTHKQRAHVFKNISFAISRLNPASTLLILLDFTGAIFYGIVWFVVPLIIANAPENTKLLGVGLSMFDFAVVITGSLLYSVIERTDKKLMVFLGLLLFSAAGLILGFSFGLPFLILAFLTTTGDELASLPLWAWLHHLDKKHNRDGLISGVINLFEDLGWAIGPLVGSIFYILIGPKLTIALGAIPLLLLLIVYEFCVREHVMHFSLLEAPKKPHKRRHKS